MKIVELPFRERPVLELLHLDQDRDLPDRSYAGYGWARVDRIWLDDLAVDDALVLALHAADDAPAMADDIVLEFELPGADAKQVHASQFLERWLPQLPQASAIVLALCNWHHAALACSPGATAPIYYATGDVESWRDVGAKPERIVLATDGSWARLTP